MRMIMYFKIIFVLLKFSLSDSEKIPSDWIETHAQKADKRNPLDYVTTFSYEDANKPIKDLVGRYFAIYENPYLRYAYDHIVDGAWLNLEKRMIRPIPPPSEVRNTDAQKKLQSNLHGIQNELLSVVLNEYNGSNNMNKMDIDETHSNDANHLTEQRIGLIHQQEAAKRFSAPNIQSRETIIIDENSKTRESVDFVEQRNRFERGRNASSRAHSEGSFVDESSDVRQYVEQIQQKYRQGIEHRNNGEITSIDDDQPSGRTLDDTVQLEEGLSAKAHFEDEGISSTERSLTKRQHEQQSASGEIDKQKEGDVNQPSKRLFANVTRFESRKLNYGQAIFGRSRVTERFDEQRTQEDEANQQQVKSSTVSRVHSRESSMEVNDRGRSNGKRSRHE